MFIFFFEESYEQISCFYAFLILFFGYFQVSGVKVPIIAIHDTITSK
jgi:hypothetical protein